MHACVGIVMNNFYVDRSELDLINLLRTTKLKQLLAESSESPNLIWNGVPFDTVVDGIL